MITTVAGGGTPPDGLGDGLPATQARLVVPQAVAVAADGSLFITDSERHHVRKVGPDGVITTVVGTGTSGFSGDGGLATAAKLWFPFGLALGPDGSLYIADTFNHRIRRVTPDGIITTVAGSGPTGSDSGSSGGDGGPATAALLSTIRGVAVGSDGSVYVAEVGSTFRIRRISTDGIITTAAGNGIGGYGGDGGPATSANINAWGIEVGPDGSLYIADTFNHRVRKVSVDGIIRTVVGTGTCCFSGDGGPATQADQHRMTDLAVHADGTIYIAGYSAFRVRAVGPDGIITTVAGIGTPGFGGENGPAGAAILNFPTTVAVGPDGALYVADASNLRVRRIAPPFPGFAVTDTLIPSQDGSEVYAFSGSGRHLRTLEALTGAVKYQFTYDAAGLLATITDADGNVTTIQRDGAGTPMAIVVPGGQQTTLTLEGNGYLASISNPNNEKVELTYSAEGLLTTLKDARGNLHTNTYDSTGRLIKDDDPAGGFKALTRTDQATGWTVALTTALTRTTTYQVENLPIGDLRRKVTDPAGLLTTTLIKPDGTTTITAPDGTMTTQVQGPDPRFRHAGADPQVADRADTFSLNLNLTSSRTVTLSNPNDPLSLATQTDSLVINGRTYTSTYTQATRLLATTTPTNRTSQVTLDAKGRVVQEHVTGLDAMGYTYDSLGRLSTITQGTGANARTST